MELFQELIFTVGLSLLVSFVFAKIFSMASSCDDTGDNSVSVSVAGVIEESVFCDEKSVVWDSESERRVCFVDEADKFNKLEEKESRAEAIGSPLTCGDDEIDDRKEVSEEVGGVGLENKISKESSVFGEAKGGVLKEEKATVGGVKLEENLVDEGSVRGSFREIQIEADDLVGKCLERAIFREVEIESAMEEISVEKREETRVLESEDNKGNESDGVESNENDGEEEEEEEGLFDDWEGIERTELDKRFGAAVVFVDSKNNADRICRLDSDIKTQLYGLHKVAIEGLCCVPQPMALKVSARANWNAWQQLGDMSREVAMEQYITLLSRSIPGWMGDDTKLDGKQVFSDARSSTNQPSNLHKQTGTKNESMSEELKPCDEECGMIGIEQSKIS